MSVVPAYELKAMRVARRYDVPEADLRKAAEVWSRVDAACGSGSLSEGDKFEIAAALRESVLLSMFESLEDADTKITADLLNRIKARILDAYDGLIPNEILHLAFNPDRSGI